jgi:hypothetical protein
LLLYMALYRHRVVSLSSDVLVPGKARTAVIMICVKCGTARLWCGVGVSTPPGVGVKARGGGGGVARWPVGTARAWSVTPYYM